MVARRQCPETNQNGNPCQSPPLKSSDYCLMHDPDYAADVAEARRLGGLRRRREVAVVGAYDLGGLETVADIRRLLQIAVLDTLSLENSIARSRTLAYLAMAATKLLETGELEQRIASLEAAVHSRRALPAPVFDMEPEEDSFTEETEL